MQNAPDSIEVNYSLKLEGNPKIYSKRGIGIFAFIFSPIFGGVLLRQNLSDIGKKKEGNYILLYSILYSITTIYIVNIPEHPTSSLTYICNMIGGVILKDYFFNKYFPNAEEYERKKFWKPLIISILITIPFFLALIYEL